MHTAPPSSLASMSDKGKMHTAPPSSLANMSSHKRALHQEGLYRRACTRGRDPSRETDGMASGGNRTKPGLRQEPETVFAKAVFAKAVFAKAVYAKAVFAKAFTTDA